VAGASSSFSQEAIRRVNGKRRGRVQGRVLGEGNSNL